MGQDLSDREIRTKFETMESTNVTAFEGTHEKLDQILTQTTKTNGKVLGLQKEVSKLKEWRSYLIGAWAVVTLFVVPLVLYINAVESNFLGEQINQLKGDIEGIIAQL